MVHQALLRSKISIALCFSLLGCQTKERETVKEFPLFNVEKIKLTMDNGLVLYKQKPLTGTIFTLFSGTTDTAELLSYLDGREHGQWKKFYPSTKTKEVRYFKNGGKTGIYNAWWENGKKQLEYSFVADEYEGECKEWNEEGQLSRIMNYRKGQEEGIQKWWYDGGKIKANYLIKNGRRYGLLGTKNCINVSDSIFKN